tara:strand:- start:312 stop:587 length:276 start_codon:yes stop_codon:yes gene_type:complete
MEKNNFILRKIPLEGFLSLLTTIYNKGADYVDFHGFINPVDMQDEITVSVPLEYMSKDVEDLYDPGDGPEEFLQEELPITSEELSKLIADA